MLMGISVVALALIIYMTYDRFAKKEMVPPLLEEAFKPWYRVLYHKYYIDELYDSIIVKPLYRLSEGCYKIFDVKIVDGLVNLVGRGVVRGSEVVRLAQAGYVGVYIFAMVAGIILMLVVKLF